MKRLILAAAAVAVVAAGVPARADNDEYLFGLTCGLNAVADPTGTVADPGRYYGELDDEQLAINPVDVTDDPTSIVVTCSVQVGGSGVASDPDAATATGSGFGTAVFAAPVTFYRWAPDSVYVCTEVDVTDAHGTTTTWYIDVADGHWVHDPAVAVCPLAF